AGNIIEVDDLGAPIQTIVSGINRPTGMCPYPPDLVGDPLSGHIFVTDNSGNILNLDPAAKTTSVLATTTGDPDGLTFTQNGVVFFVACNTDHVIRAFNSLSGALLWESCPIPDSPDGLAIGLGSLDGFIYVNCNEGTVWELGLPGTS